MKITLENPITGYEKIKSVTIDTINDLDGNDVVEILAGLMICNGWQPKTVAECYEQYAYEHLEQIEREEEADDPEGGEGTVVYPYVICEACKGSGKLFANPIDAKENQISCYFCSGKGHVPGVAK